MKDDDLRKALGEWDPAAHDDRPDPNLLARVRRRLEGSEAPGWTSGRRGMIGRMATWLQEILAGPRWVPVAGVAGIVAVAAFIALMVFLQPQDVGTPGGGERIASETTTSGPATPADSPPVTDDNATTEPDTAADKPDKTELIAEAPVATEPEPSTDPTTTEVMRALTSARDEPVQVVLTASNGVRLYWSYNPGT